MLERTLLVHPISVLAVSSSRPQIAGLRILVVAKILPSFLIPRKFFFRSQARSIVACFAQVYLYITTLTRNVTKKRLPGLWYLLYLVGLGKSTPPEGMEEGWTDPFPLPLRIFALVKWVLLILFQARSGSMGGSPRVLISVVQTFEKWVSVGDRYTSTV